MKSAWMTGKEKIEVRDVEYRKPGAGEVSVKVRACSICGTDLHFYNDYPGGKPLPLGHEIAGTVHETGPGVNDLAPGDTVVVQNHISCGKCRSCLQGKPATCSGIRNYMDDRAALAEFLCVRREMAISYEGLDFEAAAVAEPLTVALDVLERARIEPFQDICVSGPGIIGLFCLSLGLISGARSGVMLGRDLKSPRGRRRMEAALELGADLVLDTNEPGWKEELKRARPDGFERIMVTSPPLTIPPLLEFAAFDGSVIFNGISFRDSVITFDANDFHFRKLKLIASHAIPNWGFPLALDLMKKHGEYRDLITHRFPFKMIEEAFRTARSAEEEVIKVVVTLD